MLFLRKKADALSVLLYLSLLLTFTVFSSVGKDAPVLSVSVYAAALYTGASPLICPLLFISSFAVLGNFGTLPAAAISSFFLSVIFLIYKACKTKIRYGILLYTALSLAGFMLLGDVYNDISLTDKAVISAITLALTPIAVVTFKAVKEKGLRYKFSFEEYTCLTAFVAVFGIGISNLLSPEIYKGLAVIIILLCSFLFRTGITSLVSSVLGLSLSIYYAKIDYVAVFCVWGIFSQSLCALSPYLSAISIPVVDYAVQTLFNVYQGYGPAAIISVGTGALIFCLIPRKTLQKLKDALSLFREKQLSREAINRNRIMTANRLYELSGVFTEIAAAFGFLKKETASDETVKKIMEEKLIENACLNCENLSLCKDKGFPKKKDVAKLIDIGAAKGKVSFIDMPTDMAKNCKRPNDILYGLNKLLAEYRNRKIDDMNYKNGRELLAREAEGISEILRGLALDTGTLLKYRSALEKALSEELFKKGFSVSEILIYGEKESLSISLILYAKEFSAKKITDVISKALKMNMVMCEKADLTPSKFYLSFKKCADFDAVFGVANCVKDGKASSGDTHAVTKIGSDKFLVALSDGMGSGKTAETVSSVSLSLIESFYKAGLNSNLILNTVNKLLAVNSEDTFTALDVAVVDLKNSTADFIKYGSPYGFIITRSGIKIVEGNNLPLGILEELSPSVCTSELADGDIILMLSDGISDSFSSSTELVDFLRLLPAFNPQSLVDSVLERAIKNYGGERKDDMTALAVRIYKPVNEYA